jgi:hypothetical protein
MFTIAYVFFGFKSFFSLEIITRRKTCIFDCSLRLNFSRKRHFATKILLVA